MKKLQRSAEPRLRDGPAPARTSRSPDGKHPEPDSLLSSRRPPRAGSETAAKRRAERGVDGRAGSRGRVHAGAGRGLPRQDTRPQAGTAPVREATQLTSPQVCPVRAPAARNRPPRRHRETTKLLPGKTQARRARTRPGTSSSLCRPRPNLGRERDHRTSKPRASGPSGGMGMGVGAGDGRARVPGRPRGAALPSRRCCRAPRPSSCRWGPSRARSG